MVLFEFVSVVLLFAMPLLMYEGVEKVGDGSFSKRNKMILLLLIM